MPRRSLCSSSQAALYEPISSFAWSWRAEIPFEWVATRRAARNHVRSGKRAPCMIAPAVADVCRPQPAHSQLHAFLSSRQARLEPQDGRREPSGQRRRASHAARVVVGEVRHEALERRRAIVLPARNLAMVARHAAGIGSNHGGVERNLKIWRMPGPRG